MLKDVSDFNQGVSKGSLIRLVFSNVWKTKVSLCWCIYCEDMDNWWWLISAWISNYIHNKVWTELLIHSQTSTVATVEVWEWISNFIPHFMMNVITHLEAMVSQIISTSTVCSKIVRASTRENIKALHVLWHLHYNDVIMSAIVSQIISLTIVYSTVYSAQI